MAKQEEIREGMVGFVIAFGDDPDNCADKITAYLHSQGVVIKVERERLLGYDNYNDLTHELDTRFETTVVEPLIKE